MERAVQRYRGIPPSRLYLGASLVLAVTAALLVRSYATGLAEEARSSLPWDSVVVAKEPIARGQPIRAEQVAVARWPRIVLPPGSFRDTSQVSGRVALAGLAPGEAVTETRLARVRAGPVASLIPQGLRAFAVPTSWPPGAIAAGDRVDVMATYGQGQDQARTELVVGEVEVLLVLGSGSSEGGGLPGVGAGLDPSVGGDSRKAATLLLLVSPEEQERLAFAGSFGNMSVTIAPTDAVAP